MSVTPGDPKRLPPHLRPVWLGGRGMLPVFYLEVSRLGDDLGYRPDAKRPEHHGFIEPSRSMKLADYESLLASTAPRWKEIA